MSLHISMNRTLHRHLLATALCLLVVIVAACGHDAATQTNTPLRPSDTALLAPSPTPRILSHSFNPTWFVSPSLEEQIFFSDVIARASLLSAISSTETVPSDPGVSPTYRPVQELRFTTHEYLKGTGPTQLVVVVRGEHTYLTKAEAQQISDQVVSGRNTTWDGRQGVIFLGTLNPQYQAGGASGSATTTPAFAFTLSNYGPDTTEWDYSIDTLSRAWLPSRDEGSGATGASDSDSAVFITDGSESPPPVISLIDLRSKITEFEAMMAAGAGIEGFRDCIDNKIGRERHRRAEPWTPLYEKVMLTSGSASGTEIHRFRMDYREPEYSRWRILGTDMALLQVLIDDDDTDPSNGYDPIITTARPLPEGIYRFQDHMQHYRQVPCNFVPDDAYIEWTVTVTAPDGVLHEAFFDPASLGASIGGSSGMVGFSADGGVLKPAAFSVNNSTTTISELRWQNGSVVMTLKPYVSLSGHALKIIELDGTVSLTLKTNDATTTASSGRLTWSVPKQPWHADDKLMLRIEVVP